MKKEYKTQEQRIKIDASHKTFIFAVLFPEPTTMVLTDSISKSIPIPSNLSHSIWSLHHLIFLMIRFGGKSNLTKSNSAWCIRDQELVLLLSYFITLKFVPVSFVFFKSRVSFVFSGNIIFKLFQTMKILYFIRYWPSIQRWASRLFFNVVRKIDLNLVGFRQI